jgi:hypothetical protein
MLKDGRISRKAKSQIIKKSFGCPFALLRDSSRKSNLGRGGLGKTGDGMPSIV